MKMAQVLRYDICEALVFQLSIQLLLMILIMRILQDQASI